MRPGSGQRRILHPSVAETSSHGRLGRSAIPFHFHRRGGVRCFPRVSSQACMACRPATRPASTSTSAFWVSRSRSSSWAIQADNACFTIQPRERFSRDAIWSTFRPMKAAHVPSAPWLRGSSCISCERCLHGQSIPNEVIDLDQKRSSVVLKRSEARRPRARQDGFRQSPGSDA